MTQNMFIELANHFPHILDIIIHYSHGNSIKSLSEIKNVELLNLLVDFKSIIKFVKMSNKYLKKVKIDGYQLKKIGRRYQTAKICMAAVLQNCNALKYVKDQTEEICLAAVQQDGNVLMYVKKQTEIICVHAVQQNAWALEYVKKQTDDICACAVQEDGLTLEYVKNKTYYICVWAIQQNIYAYRYVDKRLKSAIKNDLGLKHMKKLMKTQYQ